MACGAVSQALWPVALRYAVRCAAHRGAVMQVYSFSRPLCNGFSKGQLLRIESCPLAFSSGNFEGLKVALRQVRRGPSGERPCFYHSLTKCVSRDWCIRVDCNLSFSFSYNRVFAIAGVGLHEYAKWGNRPIRGRSLTICNTKSLMPHFCLHPS